MPKIEKNKINKNMFLQWIQTTSNIQGVPKLRAPFYTVLVYDYLLANLN